MKKRIAIVGTLVCAFAYLAFAAGGKTAPVKCDKPNEFSPNVRVVLEIQEQNKTTISVAMVTAGRGVTFSDSFDVIENAGDSAATMLKFTADLMPQGENRYMINCNYDFQKPVAHKNSAQSKGHIRAFWSMGTSLRNTVNMTVGDTLEIFKNQTQTVKLKLEKI